MPLKHTTETFLVFLLGVVILLTGVLLSTLPDLPAGAVPWAILFVLALIYPLIFLFLFRSRRADHSFRLLHWFPALMLLVWLGFQITALERAQFLKFADWFTWGWTLPAVTLAFVLLITYCLRVIRRRATRIALLLLAFIPFVAGAMMSERTYHWDRQVASALWEGPWLASLEGKEILGLKLTKQLPIAQNLSSSKDQGEESWREKLRATEARRREVRELLRSKSGSTVVAVSSSSNSSVAAIAEVKTKPVHLPSSGPEVEVFILLMAAMYAGVLHDRARRRA
ncbi:MAG: hypothetical protein PHE68_03065 [Candidatus Peribacteraceae bacterium]|nr:hypothetical protein [Candidatus Peribacteraceae bacterium]MDD5074252.1 hypothetical protein [Candidatus Peribacteraceae bacterium]